MDIFRFIFVCKEKHMIVIKCESENGYVVSLLNVSTMFYSRDRYFNYT